MTLFDAFTTDAPLARATDPESSHLAARNIVASGTAAAHRERILAAIKANADCTCGELAELTGLHRSAVSKRLPELRRAGLIETRGSRVCTAQGTTQGVWRVVEREPVEETT